MTITVLDTGGEGLNDPMPVAPVGGNPGTTLGTQRLEALRAAANVWGARLASNVAITIGAAFDPLFCDATRALLGQASPNTALRDFPGAPLPRLWYPPALANRFAGSDLDPARTDIMATFNSAVGTTCAFPRAWYYGLDGNPGSHETDFLSVALHELGHGLGFLSLVDLASGARFLGMDDAFSRNLEDDRTGKRYPDMSDAERVAASTAGTDLRWVGRAVTAESGVLTAGRDASGHVAMYAPAVQEPGSSVSHFDKSLTPDQLLEPAYTGPNHDLGLTSDVMTDLGWDCGNGRLDVGETCDDGNTAGGDCCASTCDLEPATSPCDDHDGCTVGDACDGAGACVAGAPADCNDHNGCTSEGCAAGACAIEHLPGYAGAFCELDSFDAELCAPDPIDARLLTAIGKKVGVARRKVERAMESARPAQRARLRHAAAQLLTRLVPKVARAGRKSRISEPCRGTLVARLALARSVIKDLP